MTGCVWIVEGCVDVVSVGTIDGCVGVVLSVGTVDGCVLAVDWVDTVDDVVTEAVCEGVVVCKEEVSPPSCSSVHPHSRLRIKSKIKISFFMAILPFATFYYKYQIYASI